MEHPLALVVLPFYDRVAGHQLTGYMELISLKDKLEILQKWLSPKVLEKEQQISNS